MPLTREFTGTNIKYQMAFKTLDAETGSPQIAYVDYRYNDVTQHKTAYTYDALGNITKTVETVGGTSTTTNYTYDDQNQLTKEVKGGSTYNYSYDTYGNIRSVSGAASKTFTYGNTIWLDLLTSYNGNSITYDTVGNPTSYYNGASMTWQRGRQLTEYTNGSSTSSYLYNADGIRTRKTVNGTKHDFVYVNGQLTADLTNTNKLIFSYDDQGHPATLKHNNNVYYYVINQQGDVLALRDASNNVVASYSYNAWGELLSSSGSMANTNPLRYRGYYYDTETGFYYLQSRYYDPVICRFINADGYVSTGQDFLGFNMFAYCLNNPVTFKDPSGSRSIIEHSFGNGVVGYTDTGTGGYKYINGQRTEQYASIPYGNSTIGYSGCEAIACYNALLLLGRPESFEGVIACFVKRFYSVQFSGWDMGGRWGGTPRDIASFFDTRHISYMSSWNLATLEKMADCPGVFVISYWNKPIFDGYHTIAIKYDGSSFLGYNQNVWGKDAVLGDCISGYMANDWRFIYGIYIPLS